MTDGDWLAEVEQLLDDAEDKLRMVGGPEYRAVLSALELVRLARAAAEVQWSDLCDSVYRYRHHGDKPVLVIPRDLGPEHDADRPSAAQDGDTPG